MALGSSLGPANILALVGGNSHSNVILADTTKVVAGYHQGLRWQPQPWASVLPLVAVQDLDFRTDPQSWTPALSYTAAESVCHHCPQWQYDPETLAWPLTLGVYTAFHGSRSIGHQHRPGCSGATDIGMALSCTSGPEVTMSLSSSADHLDMNASWSLVTNLNSGCWFDPRLLLGTWWQLDPCMSIWTLTTTGPRTQTWLLLASWARMTPISVWFLMWCCHCPPSS